MSAYRICPYCGAHLDFGEKCDCRTERAEEKCRTCASCADTTQAISCAIHIAEGATEKAIMKGANVK